MELSEYGSIFNCLIVLLITFFILIWLYLRKIYNYWKDRGIPYEKPIPIIGNLGFVMRRSVWEYCYEIKNRHPRDYFGIFLAWQPVLMVQSPDLAKKILTKDFEYFQDRYLYSGYADPIGSLNLFTVKNPLWKTLRYELSPMFTSSRLKAVTNHMNSNATELVKKIKRDYIDNNKVAQLKELFSMYASDTVAYNVFGIRVSILNDKPSPLWYITSHMVKWTFWRGFEFSMIFLVPAVASFLRLQFFSRAATDYIKNLFWTVANKRKDTESSNEKDLVSLLIRLKDKLKDSVEPESLDDVILAQAAVFILGSIETSSTALAYFLHEISHHPEEQEKLYIEISEAVKRKGEDILEYHDLLELKYLTACISETLRMHSSVPYLDRLCSENYKIDDNLTVEKGTPVFINVIAIHYNEEYYPEPEKWRPERFLNANENDNVNYTFLPFGEGPRFCIGKRYGMMQVRSSLAQILLKYRIEPTQPYKVKKDPYAVILAPDSALSVKFVPR